MKAIILAAGIGKRLYPYTINIPKCLIEVAKKEIIKWEIEALLPFNFKELIIVIGYGGSLVKNLISNNFPDVNIHFVENKDYSTTSNLYSLKLGLLQADGDEIFIINGDLVFKKEVISEILKSGYENIIAVNKISCNEEDMKVCISNGKVLEVSKKISLNKADGQALGIYKIKNTNILKEKMGETNGINFFNEAINKMTKEVSIYSVDITRFPSIEIDFPEDLEEADKLFKTKDI